MPTSEQEPQEPTELQIDTSTGSPGDGRAGAPDATLVRLIRVAYPHPDFPDGPYERTATAVRKADGGGVIDAGLAQLNDLAGGDFAGLSDEDATAVVEKVSKTPFFKLVHSTTVVALYDDREVWQLLGYEGASFDKGGYLHRGFDDLDWLPDPRIEEYTGEARIEIANSVGADR